VSRESNKNMAVIYTATGMLQAVVVQEVLEKIGITVSLAYDVMEIEDDTMGTSGDVKVLVDKDIADEALKVLRSHPRTGEIFSVPKM
jgi:hypothetical protein